jgi:hypothetical protein
MSLPAALERVFPSTTPSGFIIGITKKLALFLIYIAVIFPEHKNSKKPFKTCDPLD